MVALTDADRELRAITEAQLQAAVIRHARDFGWGTSKSISDRMAEEARQYGVPVPPLDGLTFHPRYSLGSEPGWPDLTLIRRRDRRLVFAELKREKGVLSPRQAEVLDLLRELVVIPDFIHTAEWPRIEVHVWRPSDLASGRIDEVLR